MEFIVLYDLRSLCPKKCQKSSLGLCMDVTTSVTHEIFASRGMFLNLVCLSYVFTDVFLIIFAGMIWSYSSNIQLFQLRTALDPNSSVCMYLSYSKRTNIMAL